MSLARPLVRRLAARPLVRASSSVAPPADKTTPKTPAPSPRARKPSNTIAAAEDAPPEELWDVHQPAYPMHPVPRDAKFENSPFKDMPVHKTINYPTPIWAPLRTEESQRWEKMWIGAANTQTQKMRVGQTVGYTSAELGRLERAAVVYKRVSQMTKLGRKRSVFIMMVVGDPEKGLVGIGRGRSPEPSDATAKAFNQALLQMDYVHKFENRTLWGQGKDLQHKSGATTVIMRARPPGFGLQVPHILHRVLSACGIRDASASIEGSRNPLNVLNAAIHILHGGFGPPGLGSGDGRPARTNDKGAGMRSIRQIELERGRHGVDIGKRV